ncbi:Peptide-N4-(N-acetyl-beta-glucosaminyl)asparagine amidase A [Pleurostoma richardsiae]|uniref:Peptide-N4-(N-acetyl-beta-glucosaminyl)asparagine amidase A n=1 Tax=Pleurostoma richardsiae TaxID=41990 RepID=A0AA38RRR8_9PEZI|nr:Peptide-N4-(N-acetyl-beta-glucosaminyl)asparagine amidase A [Pleurostoma richardsiae]
MASDELEKKVLVASEPIEPSTRQKPPSRCRKLLAYLALFAIVIGFLSYPSVNECLSNLSSSHADSVVVDVADPGVPVLADVHVSAERQPSMKRQLPTTSAPAATATALECFQVAQPVLMPQGAVGSDGSTVTSGTGSPAAQGDSCTLVLMDHVFAYSYGIPFVSNYTPPSCSFNRVVMNFTVVSEGRQFDRLALMYMNDTEVWRTSTAEPTQHPGIRWVYMKDMTEYLYFWKSPQTIIFDLGNLIDSTYTGSFNTTLTATFFTADVDTGGAAPSDLIIPISARKGSTGGVSQFTLPQDNATNTISFPRNANRAVFSVSANGQATEEFWWSNVLQSDTLAFEATAGSLPGFSPFREVQVFIDGQLAGVQWPFPVIFTGGVVPSLHRPIVGLDAFDLREHEIDITPWLPLLSDGAEHTFTIKVAGLDDNNGASASLTESVAASWYVTGKIFVWLDKDENAVTTGDTTPNMLTSAPTISVSHQLTQSANGTNETLAYTTSVQRTVTVSARVTSQNSSRTATWSQALSYSNKGYIWDFGYSQINDFSITGSDELLLSGANASYRADYTYPLWCNSTYSESAQGNLTIFAHLVQGLDLHVQGAAVFPTGLEPFSPRRQQQTGQCAGPRFPGGSDLSTSRDGTAWFFQTGDGTSSSGFGTTNQVFRFGGTTAKGADAELFYRDVTATNGTVVADEERVAGVSVGGNDTGVASGSGGSAAALFAQAPEDGGKGGPRAFAGRQGATLR